MSQPTTLAEMILPDRETHYGTLFGGHGLSLMTRAACAPEAIFTMVAVDDSGQPIPVSTLEKTA